MSNAANGIPPYKVQTYISTLLGYHIISVYTLHYILHSMLLYDGVQEDSYQ